MTRCPECDGERVETGLRTADDGNGLRLRRRTRIQQDLIKNRHLYGWDELDD